MPLQEIRYAPATIQHQSQTPLSASSEIGNSSPQSSQTNVSFPISATTSCHNIQSLNLIFLPVVKENRGMSKEPDEDDWMCRASTKATEHYSRGRFNEV